MSSLAGVIITAQNKYFCVSAGVVSLIRLLGCPIVYPCEPYRWLFLASYTVGPITARSNKPPTGSNTDLQLRLG